jgi:hypothetical protein
MVNGKQDDSLFTISYSCKQKFVVCPFVCEETNGRFPFANGLNGLAIYVMVFINSFDWACSNLFIFHRPQNNTTFP